MWKCILLSTGGASLIQILETWNAPESDTFSADVMPKEENFLV